jgi:hypothetical protein
VMMDFAHEYLCKKVVDLNYLKFKIAEEPTNLQV